jgi:hypothetical protein
MFLFVISVVFMPMQGVLALAGQRFPASPMRDMSLPVPTVAPESVDLGTLRPGEEGKGSFFINDTGAVNPDWFAEAPDGWKTVEENGLPGLVGEAPTFLQITLRCQKVFSHDETKYAALILRMAAGDRSVSLTRDVPLGDLREKLQFNYVGGRQHVFIIARLSETPPIPYLELDALRVDFGKIRPGETVSQRLQLTNKGKTPLKWKVRTAGVSGEPFMGRYLSFRRVLTDFPSVLIGQPQEGLELSGNWEKKGGYPAGQGEQSVLKYQFTGTGIILYLWKSPEGGVLSAFLDDQFVDVIDGYAETRESAEFQIADRLTDGPHVLTVTCGDGKVAFEGATISGGQIVKGPRGLVTIFPDSGVTARETDYVNISVSTRGLLPGVYGETLLFSSNGGDTEVQLFLEVAGDRQSRLIDVHRYLAGSDLLLTSTPQAETARIQARGYHYGGVAFRLFAPGTPGTTEFYRWFSPTVGDHFYSYNPGDAKRLSGYIYEGPIGNIGTSKLAGTRELYRWVNRKTKRHFYTTDLSGEGMAQKGYQYDAIAGFIR